MILTITLNAAIDKRYVVAGSRPGEVNRVQECSYTPGGKGLNVSKPVKIAGAEIIATGFVGGNAGNYIVEQLKELGIASDFYHVKEESRSCINIWDMVAHTQTEFLEPGFAVQSEDLEGFIDKFQGLIKTAEVVVMSGSAPRGVDANIYRRMIPMVKSIGKKVILDSSGEFLSEGIRSCPTMIKPNIDEIRFLTGLPCNTKEEIIQAAIKIHEKGIAMVVVSLGGAGSILVCEEGVYVATIPKIQVVNTVGCGDAMIAGFAISLEEKLGREESLRRASAISAASALGRETGFFRIEDMQKLSPQIKIEKWK